PSFDRRMFDRAACSTTACSSAPRVRPHRMFGRTARAPEGYAPLTASIAWAGARRRRRTDRDAGPGSAREIGALTRSPHPTGELAPHPAGRQVPVVENVLADSVVVQDALQGAPVGGPA